MTYSPLSLSRRHVLGDLYSRCEPVVNVPVYLNGADGEMLGYADQALGHYADAFSFHLTEEYCKKLSAGHFTYSFDYEFAEPDEKGGKNRRIRLNSIVLVPRKGYDKPIPKKLLKLLETAAGEQVTK